MSGSQVGLSRTQVALHATHRTPHGASRLVHAMSAWSVKTRRAPSRLCRDARVYTTIPYSHTTAAMHGYRVHPPLPRLPPLGPLLQPTKNKQNAPRLAIECLLGPSPLALQPRSPARLRSPPRLPLLPFFLFPLRPARSHTWPRLSSAGQTCICRGWGRGVGRG